MKTRIFDSGWTVIGFLALTLPGVLAAPPMRGPLPEEQQAIIHELATHHEELKREVKMTTDGYSATTTTENKELAVKLKAHLAYMEKRLESKAMVRRWDPAFVELVEYYDQLDTTIIPLDNGVKVVVKGKSPEATKVAQNHARIVSGFAKEGPKAVQREHTPALPANKTKGAKSD